MLCERKCRVRHIEAGRNSVWMECLGPTIQTEHGTASCIHSDRAYVINPLVPEDGISDIKVRENFIGAPADCPVPTTKHFS